MTLFHLFLVAVIQGLTEFLPVSSSGHLILLPQLTGMEDQGQTIDVAVHVGTLFAVVLYFWSDVKSMLSGIPDVLFGRFQTHGAKLLILLSIATVPVVIAGLILKLTGLDDAMRSTAVIGWTMIIFGLILWRVDYAAPKTRITEEWSLKHAIIMGLWQALALIPGTSRSGATITGARALGYDRASSAKLAMLMSIPTILASGTLLGLEVAADANTELAQDAAIAAVFAFFAALLALVFMMRLLRTVSFAPYVYYRLGLGVILLMIAY